ncbi:uncharacterized protein LOC143199948 [Rhynchophorus ferrugineus]|uniref:Nuclear cap-binding protein subunit 3 n=1 Tax=Rhynchophorus ferrugineus TaxID=354439 RepID=A0A834IE01_RHYFE|nr:hypothetical protein GWI33_009069 [Rhynchophorus ferrugineus]
MDTDIENNRPNIRIQIENNCSNNDNGKMDIDSENEEGEILDDTETELPQDTQSIKKITFGGTGVFTTGINIFDRSEQEKLQERAKRFALKPDEIHSFTHQNKLDLFESLGINTTNENDFNFDKIHLLGLGNMEPEDIVDYFSGYAPDGIEWTDENSCNVVWLDNLSAARAMHFKSKPVRGMPARQTKDIFPKEFLDDVEEPTDNSGQSILIKNQNREIELQNEIGEVILPTKKNYPKNSVDISEITIPIPPGYWRLGVPHPKTKCLLIRFAMVSDKIPFKFEKCNRYYKKFVNPTQKGSIRDHKKELRSIFERNRELNQNKNPWGSLARNWDNDSESREREPVMYNDSDNEEPVIEIKNPKLLARLGIKRKHDEIEETLNSAKQTEDQPEIKERKKITRVPRMKMYADEEEENMKRKKIIQKIKKQTEEIERTSNEKDLRHMLGPANRLMMRKDHPDSDRTEDLGSKLKNRNQKMIFAIERDLSDLPPPIEHLARDYLDMSEKLSTRNRSGRIDHFRSNFERSSMYREYEDRERGPPLSEGRREYEMSSKSSRRRTPERTLHSDRVYSSTSSKRRRRSYSGERITEKPKSKVAVVIKTQKTPTVASTIWSKVKRSSDSRSSSESESAASSSSSESESESEESDEESDSSDSSRKRARNPDRPGFDKTRLSRKLEHKSPLKITMANDRYRNRK